MATVLGSCYSPKKIMWFKRKVAVDMDTGEQFSVMTGISDFEDDTSPTSFFRYFSDVPIHNAVNQCLKIIDLTELISDLSEEEETKEAPSDSRHLKVVEGGGMEANPKKGEEEWKKSLKI